MQKQLITLITLTLACLQIPAQAQSPAAQCSALQGLTIEGARINSAGAVAAGFFQAPGTGNQDPVEVPDFCRVSLTVEPAVNIEVWLPVASNWNGRYLAVGGGGLAGVISYPAMVPAIQGGYVTSSTDTGHLVSETDWLSDPDLLRDYGYRAIHEMALKSKLLINAYYARSPDYSYFNGCSTGGRQGLMEAQRFPDDFDGIVSGAPVNYFTATHYTQLWISEAAKPENSTILPPDILGLVSNAVLGQCDAIDGVADGVLEDPRQCDFQPASLQCGAGQTAACLNSRQVQAMEKIYRGPVHGVTGEPLHYSLVPGGERPSGYPGWILAGGSGVFDIPRLYFSLSVFQDPDWDWRSFNFSSDIDLAMNRTAHILEATSPNLDAFQGNGGKLILYHGWDDPVIFPEGSIAYYESIIENLPMSDPASAAMETAGFARLFMVPGMAHCRGGPGTDQFDMQSALEDWVENANPPAMIPARHIENGEVTRSRPLCPYPQTARYNGSGDSNEISNFACRG